MPSEAEVFEAILDQAAEIARTEVTSWYAVKKDDHIVGKVVNKSTIQTIYGTYYTTTLDVSRNKPVMDGKTLNPGLYVVAWMGAVLQSQYLRLGPTFDDVVAMHYQKDVEPKTKGFNPYKLVNAAVFDASTGKPKEPARRDIEVPSEDQLRDVDEGTGEIRPGRSPREQFSDLPPFPEDDE
jgi:hypothetical protein